MGVMRLASCGVPTRHSRRRGATGMTKRGNAATRQLYLVKVKWSLVVGTRPL